MGTSPDPDDLPAGLPSARSNTVVIAIATVVLSIPFLALIGYGVSRCASEELGDTLAEIGISGLDQPAEKPLTLAEGAELAFGVDTGYEYQGGAAARLDVELTRAGAAVAETSCLMKSWTGSGSGVGHTGSAWYGDFACRLVVPPGGADGVRAKVRNTGSGRLVLTDTKLLVKR